ncbi:MAG: ATP-binding protein [Candidatus Bathyarchaeota archaeon]|nr:MAG: ATP-binding protein [Candidatus Bathyarchaeota archaeon]
MPKGLMLPSNFGYLIEGGIPEGNNILLIGPPGNGKTIFCENMANEYMRNNIKFVYVTLDKTPEEVKNDFLKHGLDLSEGRYIDEMFFVDGYTWLIGKSNEKYHVDSLSNLTELQFRIARAALELPKPLLLIFDSISPLSLYNSESFVMKFLQLLFARIKEWKSLGIFVVQAGVHSQEFYNTLGYMVDGIFDMKINEEDGVIKRFFRVRNISSVAHETRWAPFTIGENRTITLLSEGGEKG